MYYILEIINNEINIVDHISNENNAINLLEKTARLYLEEQCGKPWNHKSLIHELEIIPNANLMLNMIPEEDGIYMIKLKTEKNKIYLYKRFTRINRGYVMNSIDTTINLVKTYIIVKYNLIFTPTIISTENLDNLDNINNLDNLDNADKKDKLIPQQMKISPYTDMMVELTNNSKFLIRKVKYE
jgi:hypothetical protein